MTLSQLCTHTFDCICLLAGMLVCMLGLIVSGKMARLGSSKQTCTQHQERKWTSLCAAHRALLAVHRIVGDPKSAVHVVTIIENQLHRGGARVAAMMESRLRAARVVGGLLLARYCGSTDFLHISNAGLKLDDLAEVRSGALEVARV